MQIFLPVKADGSERFFVIHRRNGQRPASHLVLVNDVFDALTGQDETPIHRLTTGVGGNPGVERLRRRLHRRMVNRGQAPGKRTANAKGIQKTDFLEYQLGSLLDVARAAAIRSRPQSL